MLKFLHVTHRYASANNFIQWCYQPKRKLRIVSESWQLISTRNFFRYSISNCKWDACLGHSTIECWNSFCVLIISYSDKCSFCGTYTEELYLFFNCSIVRAFWNLRFTLWWSDLDACENLSLSLKDVIIGLLHRKNALNYLINLGKITIWQGRKNKISPNFGLVGAKQEGLTLGK